MHIGAIIQARMSSHRFPGKTLHLVHGKPMLGYLVERLLACRGLSSFVVATSAHQSDDAIETYCRSENILCYRGELADLAARFCGALKEHAFDAFVRVNGDSPLIDPALIEEGIRLYLSTKPDLVTNVFPRTYPKGQSVEIMGRGFFSKHYPSLETEEDHEHITAFFYRNRSRFRILNFESEGDYSRVQLSVDNLGDMCKFKKIIGRMDRPHWEYTWREILSLLNLNNNGSLGCSEKL